MAAILIIEDELVLAHQLAVALESVGHDVALAGTAKEGLEALGAVSPDIVLLDLRLPDRSGLDVISAVNHLDQAIAIVLMTAYGSDRDAIEALRRGASGYLTKPIDVGELGLLIERLVREPRRERELAHLRETSVPLEMAALAKAPEAVPLFEQVGRMCDASMPPGMRPPLLLRGEPGSGRQALARAVHERLGGGPFVVAAAEEGDGFAQHLLGMERAATPDGGSRSVPGLCEAAHGGTLLLHEIGRLPTSLQKVLLRVTETHGVRRLGASRERHAGFHLVATTSADLEDASAAGCFEPELLGRLQALTFDVPPLRERRQTVLELARHMAAVLGTHRRGAPARLTAEAEQALAGHAWPGNVPELSAAIERAVMLGPTPELGLDRFAGLLEAVESSPVPGRVFLPDRGVRLVEVEKDLMQQALGRTRGNQTRAAAMLGLSRDTLRYRMRKLGIERRGGAKLSIDGEPAGG